MKRWQHRRLWFVAWLLMVLGMWTLGCLGFAAEKPDRDWVDNGLLASQLFTLESNVGEDRQRPMPWALSIARVSAPLLTKVGVLSVAVCVLFPAHSRKKRPRRQPRIANPAPTSVHATGTVNRCVFYSLADKEIVQ